MSFYEPAFLFMFLPLALAVFFGMGRLFGPEGALAALILATLVFLSSYGAGFFAVVIASTILNAAVFSLLLKDGFSERTRDAILLLGIGINVAPLLALKMSVLAFSLPMTISFVAFQRIATLIPAHQRSADAGFFSPLQLGSGLRYAGFTLSFPNILIGPIAYLSEVGPQLMRRQFGKMRPLDLAAGSTLLVIGLVKKILIADPLNAIIAPVFDAANQGATIPPLEAILAMLAYTAFLFFDFSAYSDMALGIARMFGIRLPVNFNAPLRAVSIVDFWKRWHITLTRVIVSFLFTPLSVAGSRFAFARKLKGWRARAFQSWLPLVVNFQVIALWHGITWNFLLFGLFHATVFVADNEFRRTKLWSSKFKPMPPLLRRVLGQTLTLVLVTISLALVRSDSPGAFAHLMASVAGDWTLSLSPATRILSGSTVLTTLLPAYLIVLLAPTPYEFMRRYRPGIMTYTVLSNTPAILQRLRWRPTLSWAILAAAAAAYVFTGINLPTPFVYGGF